MCIGSSNVHRLICCSIQQRSQHAQVHGRRCSVWTVSCVLLYCSLHGRRAGVYAFRRGYRTRGRREHHRLAGRSSKNNDIIGCNLRFDFRIYPTDCFGMVSHLSPFKFTPSRSTLPGTYVAPGNRAAERKFNKPTHLRFNSHSFELARQYV